MKHRIAIATCICALALPIAAFAGEILPPPEPGDLLGSTGAQGGSLVDIDPTTGAGTFRAPLGTFGPVTEIVFAADGTLYGTTGQGTANLITIDPTTGAETLVGNHGAEVAVNGLAFVDGTLYGSQFSPGKSAGPEGASTLLVTVDLATGATTEVGFLAFGPVRGLAYDGETLYATVFPQVEGQGEILVEVDPTDGTTTPIGPIGFEVGGIRFGPDGVLYGGTIGAGPQAGEGGGGSQLIAIDTATGAGTPIGPIGQFPVSGLAFVPAAPGGGEEPIVSIPTVDWRGGLALLALLAGAGLLVLRRAA